MNYLPYSNIRLSTDKYADTFAFVIYVIMHTYEHGGWWIVLDAIFTGTVNPVFPIILVLIFELNLQCPGLAT